MFANFAGENSDVHENQGPEIDLTLALPLEPESTDTSATMDDVFTCAVRDIIGSEYVKAYIISPSSLLTYFSMNTWLGRKPIRHQTWKMRRTAEFQNWDPLMTPLIDAFIDWRYNTPQSPGTHESTDNLYIIRVFDLNMVSNSKMMTYTIARPPNSISPAIDFVKHGFLVKTPMLPEVAISLKTLEFYHRVRLQKALYSAEAFAKVICDFYLICTIIALFAY